MLVNFLSMTLDSSIVSLQYHSVQLFCIQAVIYSRGLYRWVRLMHDSLSQ